MARIRLALLLWGFGATAALASTPARLATNIRPGETLRAGDAVTLRLASDEGIEEMEVLLSLDGGRTFQLRVTREMPNGSREVTWRVPNLPTTTARLALRVRDEDGEEVVRSISDEFTIAGEQTEPLEVLRRFGGEWRAGDALGEIPATAPIDAPGLGGVPESIQAVRHDTDFGRNDHAAVNGDPPDGEPVPVQAIHAGPSRPAVSPRLPLNVPRRE